MPSDRLVKLAMSLKRIDTVCFSAPVLRNSGLFANTFTSFGGRIRESDCSSSRFCKSRTNELYPTDHSQASGITASTGIAQGNQKRKRVADSYPNTDKTTMARIAL